MNEDPALPEVTEGERWYDEEIAPELLKLAERCEGKGMSFVASVEFDRNRRGSTYAMCPSAGTAIRMVRLCVEAAPNLDGFVIALLRLAQRIGIDTSESMVAKRLEGNEMSPEFTDTARAALAWVLWHHQGRTSKIGQAMRFALGMGEGDRMNASQVADAKLWATFSGQALEDPSEQLDRLLEKVELDRLAAMERAGELRLALSLFVKAAHPVSKEIDSRGHRWSEAYLDAALDEAKKLGWERQE